MKIMLEKPNKEAFFKDLKSGDSVCWMDQIWWLVNSELDVTFYREEKGKDKFIEISKKEMMIAVEENWEMR